MAGAPTAVPCARALLPKLRHEGISNHVTRAAGVLRRLGVSMAGVSAVEQRLGALVIIP